MARARFDNLKVKASNQIRLVVRNIANEFEQNPVFSEVKSGDFAIEREISRSTDNLERMTSAGIRSSHSIVVATISILITLSRRKTWPEPPPAEHREKILMSGDRSSGRSTKVDIPSKISSCLITSSASGWKVKASKRSKASRTTAIRFARPSGAGCCPQRKTF
jgi:hypothetical protein